MIERYRAVTWKPSKNHWINDAQVDALRQRVKEADAHNDEVYRQKRAAYNQLMSLADIVFGGSSSEMKYLRRARIPAPPSHQSVLKKIEKEIRERDRLVRQREKAADYRLRQEEAIARLEDAGFVRGTDFARSNAITFAKNNLEVVGGRYVRRSEPMLEMVP